MWIYKCNAGIYREHSVLRLLLAILSHRLAHLLNGEGFID
jgi:hypothetical protein